MPSRSDSPEDGENMSKIDIKRSRFPYSVVWTPIPLLTWFFPFIGHMGITTSKGIVRDFAGPYLVSEDEMAFGKPTRYLLLSVDKVIGGQVAWDKAVKEASDIYSGRIHNLLCDNCHSHVAMALNIMKYDGSENWNMVNLALRCFIFARYVNFYGFIKTWLPFIATVSTIAIVCFFISKQE